MTRSARWHRRLACAAAGLRPASGFYHPPSWPQTTDHRPLTT